MTGGAVQGREKVESPTDASVTSFTENLTGLVEAHDIDGGETPEELVGLSGVRVSRLVRLALEARSHVLGATPGETVASILFSALFHDSSEGWYGKALGEAGVNETVIIDFFVAMGNAATVLEEQYTEES